MIVDYVIPEVAGRLAYVPPLILFPVLFIAALIVLYTGSSRRPAGKRIAVVAVLTVLAVVSWIVAFTLTQTYTAAQEAVNLEHYPGIAVEAGYEDVTVVDESVVGRADDGSIVEIRVTRLDGDPERYAVEEVAR